MKDVMIFEKEYTSEGIGDMPQDVGEAFIPDFNPVILSLPDANDDGFCRGTFVVTIKWVDELEDCCEDQVNG